jgi:phytoene dehydrogenase-like protein
MNPSPSHVDAIVIGAGHNGLAAAAYLARAGRRVLVLERRPLIGGATVTEEVWPGYRVSSASYLCSLLHPTIIEDLALRDHGFEVYRREASGFAPFPDGSYLLLYPDAARTRAELERFCPRDVEAYFRFEADVERAADILEPWFLGPPPSLAQLAVAFRSAGAGDLFEPLFTGSVRALLESRFTDERLMAALATDGLIGTAAGPSDPGTAYVLLHHMMGRVLGARGLWGYVRGGMGRVAGALAAAASAHGAEIRAGAGVSRILTREGRAAGVVTEEGDTYFADVVLSNAHPSITYGLVDESLPADAARAVERWRTAGVSCKINMAVGELPDFACLPGAGPGPQHLGTIHLAPSMDFLDAAWEDARAGRPSAEPMVEVYIQTATDRTLAPPGKHILSCFTQYFPRALAEGLDRAVETARYADRVVESIARYAPNVPASIEAREVLTPADLEERFGLVGGHIFHGEITPDQMFGHGGQAGRLGLAGPETPVRGLVLCGSGAYPGGCVSGLPGYNAARFVLSRPSGPP